MSKDQRKSAEIRNDSRGARRVEYDDDIWASEREPSAELTDLLTATDCLVVLNNGALSYQAVIGVPHQAAVGEEYICEKCEEGKRVSDENAASYALVAFSELSRREIPCRLVIMAHPTKHDPNKTPDSPYWKEIFEDHSELLFECHGAASGRRDLELSAGSNGLADPRVFGQLLTAALDNRFVLGVQQHAGGKTALILGPVNQDEVELRNPGLKTTSLIEADRRGVPALHLEATPRFRKPEDETNTVTDDGFALGQAIAYAIVQYLDDPHTSETRNGRSCAPSHPAR